MSGTNPQLVAKTLAEITYPTRAGSPVQTHAGGWILSFYDQPEVVILDSRLQDIARVDVQAQAQECCRTEVAMSKACVIAVSSRDELRLVSATGAVIDRFPHRPWESWEGSSCLFDRKDRLWYVRPVPNPDNANLPP